jgi:hypothetical protein
MKVYFYTIQIVMLVVAQMVMQYTALALLTVLPVIQAVGVTLTIKLVVLKLKIRELLC